MSKAWPNGTKFLLRFMAPFLHKTVLPSTSMTCEQVIYQRICLRCHCMDCWDGWNQCQSLPIIYPILVGGWATPLKNMTSSIGMIIPNIWENKKCSKPPTRIISNSILWLGKDPMPNSSMSRSLAKQVHLSSESHGGATFAYKTCYMISEVNVGIQFSGNHAYSSTMEHMGILLIWPMA